MGRRATRRPAAAIARQYVRQTGLLFGLLGTSLALRDAAAQAPLSATAIYDRARATVAARPIPPYLAYTQYAAFIRHGRTRTQIDRIVLRVADGRTNVTPVDAPHSSARVENRPLIVPTTTFGLAGRRAGERPSALEVDGPPQSGPPVIGSVTAVSRDYDATLAGVESLDGARVYHLVMTPRFDPRRNRIRALFVDTVSFDPRRIVIEYFAERGPLHARPTVTVDYVPAGPTWVIARATMDVVVRFGFFAYGGSGDFRTSDMTFPSIEPDRLFDSPTSAQ